MLKKVMIEIGKSINWFDICILVFAIPIMLSQNEKTFLDVTMPVVVCLLLLLAEKRVVLVFRNRPPEIFFYMPHNNADSKNYLILRIVIESVAYFVILLLSVMIKHVCSVAFWKGSREADRTMFWMIFQVFLFFLFVVWFVSTRLCRRICSRPLTFSSRIQQILSGFLVLCNIFAILLIGRYGNWLSVSGTNTIKVLSVIFVVVQLLHILWYDKKLIHQIL